MTINQHAHFLSLSLSLFLRSNTGIFGMLKSGGPILQFHRPVPLHPHPSYIPTEQWTYIVKKHYKKLGGANLISIFGSFKAMEGPYYYLGSVIKFSNLFAIEASQMLTAIQYGEPFLDHSKGALNSRTKLTMMKVK